MRPPIGRDDAEERSADVVVKKQNLAWRLDDLCRRSDARHTRRLALQRRVDLDLPFTQVLHLGKKLRLVLWKIRCRWRRGWASRSRTCSTAGRCASRRTANDAHGAAVERLRTNELNPAQVIPRAVEVRLAVRQP